MKHTITPVLVLVLALLPIAAHAQGSCTVGVNGPPAGLFARAITQPDVYWTRIDPQACGCPGSAAQFDTVHVLVNIPTSGWHPGGFFTFTIDVSGADWTTPDCPRPGSGSMLPSQYQWDSPPLAPGDHDLAIPVHFTLDQTAFLQLQVHFMAGWATLLKAEGCQPCVSWSFWDGLMDQCVDLPYGNPVIYATGQCTGPVGARGRTWGELKTLYR